LSLKINAVAHLIDGALERYGWDDEWQVRFAPLAAQGLAPARVILEHTHIYTVVAEHGEVFARVSGRFRHAARARHEFPAVGDWVGCRFDEVGGRAQIHAVAPRRSRFSRKTAGITTDEQVVAANIDTVFIVMGCDDDFNLRRLERYLVLTRESGASPVVLLNKADRDPAAEQKREETERIARGVPVHLTSAKTGAGMDAIDAHLTPGCTIALLGSSGVGKSSIINWLVGHDLLRTREVRESDSRGRHTTRHRQLVRLSDGAMVIDTPGMRELHLWDVSEGVSETFEDIEALAPACRFRDCTHRTEPGCAVRAAAEAGGLAADRLESYLKLEEERRHIEEKSTERAQQEAKRRGKILSRARKLYKSHDE
jgi:ribosome biogenesis GTPase